MPCELTCNSFSLEITQLLTVYLGRFTLVLLKEPDWAQDGVAHVKLHVSKPKVKSLCSALPEKKSLSQPSSTCLLSRGYLPRLQDFPLLHIRECFSQSANAQDNFLVPTPSPIKSLALYSSSEFYLLDWMLPDS